MPLFFASLNSGSNGNCYYVGNANEAVLIDAGISCKEFEKRMAKLNLSLKKVKGIFISHEHIDHIKGVEMIAKKHGISIHVNEKTLKGAGNMIPHDSVNLFKSGDTIKIGELLIHSFSKMHDAADPVSFTIEHIGYRIGVMTDIGKVCDNTINHFNTCNAVFLEANYDDEMLEKGKYPYLLKKRISGDFGHLSNDQALILFNGHRSQQLSHLLLAHLSKENNSPAIVKALFEKHALNTSIHIASRDEPTGIFCIGPDEHKKAAPTPVMQLDLFSN
jgi:phosphoribosyl 1,2-cyclic phosphodiesterase